MRFGGNAEKEVPEKDLVLPLKKSSEKPLMRIKPIMSEITKEKDAMEICRQKINAHQLPMRLIDAEYTLIWGRLYSILRLKDGLTFGS